ncbi:hypothetical protein QFC24_001519 [Naganishia onofrii]|uniref:Uncharacterized protein n=1 Tax=Naganishia onofrii TaxID=1851511 RepID=A0ACC2XUG6_9TREE|nr:hypothetical protein QFC24_001519 [Naganishia onofrii]
MFSPEARVTTPSSGEQVKPQKLPVPLTFSPPARQGRSVQTYGKNFGKAKLVQLLPAATIDSDSQSTDQSIIEEAEAYTDGDQSGDATDADDEDHTPFGTDSFTPHSLHNSDYDFASPVQDHENAILEHLYSIVQDFWRSIAHDYVARVQNSDAGNPPIPVGTSLDRDLFANKLKNALDLAYEIWGPGDQALEQSRRLLRSPDLVLKFQNLSGDENITKEALKYLEHCLVQCHHNRHVNDEMPVSFNVIGDDQDCDDYSINTDLGNDEPTPDLQNASLPFKVFAQAKTDAINGKLHREAASGITPEAKIQKPVQKMSDLDESWMEPTPVVVPAAKKKKNKRKKKTLAGMGSTIPGSAGYFNLHKEGDIDAIKPNDSGALKPSISIVSHVESEMSSVEPAIRSAFATTNIFEQLKRTDLGEERPPPSDEQKEVDSTSVASAELMERKEVSKATDSSDTKQDQLQPVALKTAWVDSVAIESWADTDDTANISPTLEPPSRDAPPTPAFDGLPSAEPGMVGPDLQVASTGVASGRGFFAKRRGVPKNRWGHASQHDQRKPYHNANNANKPDNRQGSAQDKVVIEKTPVPHQTPGNPFNHPRLSYRDMNDGATIELHPVKRTECCILREPLERPDYDCTLFVAGYVLSFYGIRVFLR